MTADGTVDRRNRTKRTTTRRRAKHAGFASWDLGETGTVGRYGGDSPSPSPADVARSAIRSAGRWCKRTPL